MDETIAIPGGEKFFCPACHLHIAFCQCEEYKDTLSYVPSDKVKERRALKMEIQAKIFTDPTFDSGLGECKNTHNFPRSGGNAGCSE